MKVSLVAVTSPLITGPTGDRLTPDEFIVYCARVSNPSNQLNTETAPKLIRYCIQHGHWSIFEQASMTLEITTSRAVSAQIIRHRSFSFQEFSQRYSPVVDVEWPEMRLKAAGGNRQGSDDDVAPVQCRKSDNAIAASIAAYRSLLDAGIAPECARMVLPMCASTTLYMTGSARSWIHYLKARLDSHTQKEHRLVAQEAEKHFKSVFPVVWEAAFEEKQ